MSKEQISGRENGVTLEQLEHALKLSFSPDILADPTDWTSDYPAFGHCSAAAQITHDLFGGEIHGFWFDLIARKWNGRVRSSHFLNVLPDGKRVDFTRSQFPPDFPYDVVMAPEKSTVVNRKEIFSNAGSAGQYARLKIAVTRNLWDSFGMKIDCSFLTGLPWENS